MKHDNESMQIRDLVYNEKLVQQTVIYNPNVSHWYLDTNDAFPMDYYPTKHGYIDSKSLTKTLTATQYFAINLEHLTSYDVLFLKDSHKRIGVFTMVDGSGQELGNFFRTDHKGFGYTKAHLYINMREYHQSRGAQHYLTTEDLNGKWTLLCLYHPQDIIKGGYNEFINRYCLAKDFHSETEAINYFKNELNGADLLDSDMFAYINPAI